MQFKPKTFSVDLAAASGPDQRARLIAAALPEAERQLGARPTHALVDSQLRINMELLDEAGVAVRRMAFGWPSRYLARLAVAVREPAPRAVPGAPAPIAPQARLV